MKEFRVEYDYIPRSLKCDADVTFPFNAPNWNKELGRYSLSSVPVFLNFSI